MSSQRTPPRLAIVRSLAALVGILIVALSTSAAVRSSGTDRAPSAEAPASAPPEDSSSMAPAAPATPPVPSASAPGPAPSPQPAEREVVAATPGVPARLAVTIDDLPWAGTPIPDRAAATDRLLKALRDRGVVATGFVICGRVDDRSILKRWLDAGMSLGNHSWAHRDLDGADLDTWLEDAGRCDAMLREVLGGPVRYFRYPYLHQGATAERRDAAAAKLRALGLANAHVTVDTSEWRLARWYDEATAAGDARRRESIAAAYVEHMRVATRHFRTVAREKASRDVAHVLLLHANTLAADHLGAVLDALTKDGVRFIPLEEALEDPVFTRKDEYLGVWGSSWLYRIAPVTDDPVFIKEEDRRMIERFGGDGAP